MGLQEAFDSVILENFLSNNNFLNFALRKVGIPVLRNFSGVKLFEDFCDKNLTGLSLSRKPEDLNFFLSQAGITIRVHQDGQIDFTNKKVMIVSNHPTGPSDSIFIHKAFHSLGICGKILGDDIMNSVPQMKDSYIGLSTRNEGKSRIAQLRRLKKELQSGTNLSLFPSGSVSKFNFKKFSITEDWNTGFLEIAKSNNMFIVPVYISANLSPLHYLFKEIHDDISSLRLFRESLSFVKKNRGEILDLYIGDPIDPLEIESNQEEADKIRNICENLKYQHYKSVK